jgi:hypothetical protein
MKLCDSIFNLIISFSKDRFLSFKEIIFFFSRISFLLFKSSNSFERDEIFFLKALFFETFFSNSSTSSLKTFCNSS